MGEREAAAEEEEEEWGAGSRGLPSHTWVQAAAGGSCCRWCLGCRGQLLQVVLCPAGGEGVSGVPGGASGAGGRWIKQLGCCRGFRWCGLCRCFR